MKLRRCLGCCVTQASNAPTMNDTLNRISFKQHFILHISRVVHVKSSKPRIRRVKNLKAFAATVLSAEGVDESIFDQAGGIFSVAVGTRQSFQENNYISFRFGKFSMATALNGISRATLVGWVDKMSFTKRRFNPKKSLPKNSADEPFPTPKTPRSSNLFREQPEFLFLQLHDKLSR